MSRLRRSVPSHPGITRRRCGKGFVYFDPDGRKVSQAECLERIKALVIPPAWADVWICPWANGHIQAMGTDAAGRRQYLYHQAWRLQKDREKWNRALEFGRALPSLRAVVAKDLTTSGLGRRRLLALGVRLMDLGAFRIGGEEYAEENETFGVATLQIRHVSVEGDQVVFRYAAKGSIRRTVVVEDAEVRRAVVSILRRARRPRANLLAWTRGGEWHDIRSADLNAYIKAGVGDEFSAKDFRTWSATVLAAVHLAHTAPASSSERHLRQSIAAAVSEVADALGNTPTVCRTSYIDPRVIDRFRSGETIARVGLAKSGQATSLQARHERAVIEMLRRDPGTRRRPTVAA